MQPKAAANAPKELGKPLAVPVQVTRVRFALDGKLLAAACFDGKVRLWDVSGKEPAELPALGGHDGWVTGVAFGVRLLYTIDSWGRLKGWSFTEEPERVRPRAWEATAHDGWARALAYSPRATAVATCGRDGFVRVWDRLKGDKRYEYDLKADTLSVCYSSDGTALYAGDLFGTVHEIANGKLARTFQVKEFYKLDRIQDVGGVKCLALSHDGKTLFAGGAEPKGGGFVECTPLLVAIDLASGKRTSQWKGANPAEGFVTDIAPHADGRVLFTTSGQPGQGKLHVWKPGDAATSFTGGKLPNCHSVALHPNGELAAVSATNANSSGNGRVKGTGGDYPNNASPVQLWKV